jgi:hypothetical protein
MPIHDWTRVDAGTFHAFHLAWIGQLQAALNGGLLPEGYYARAEQHAGAAIPDILTMHTTAAGPSPRPPAGKRVATVTKTRPHVQRRLAARGSPKGKQRSLAVRHVSGHQIIALVEIVSPGNKDRKRSVTSFVNKAIAAIQLGIHVSLLDLLRPGPHDPGGMHAAVWERFEPDKPQDLPAGRPLTLAAYAAGPPPKAYIDYRAVGETLPEMSLFLSADEYIHMPLEATYAEAYRGMPEFWREVIEGKHLPA